MLIKLYGCLAALNQLYLFCSVCYPCMSCVLFCKHSGSVTHLLTLAFIQGPVWFPVCRVQADCPRFYSDSWLSFAQSNTNFISLSYILWWKHPRIKGCELFGPPLPPQAQRDPQPLSQILSIQYSSCQAANSSHRRGAAAVMQLASDQRSKMFAVAVK